MMAFLIVNQANKIRFFKKTFLIVNIILKILFEIYFFILNNINIDFLKQKLKQRSYITKKTFLNIKYIKLLKKKKFIVVAFNLKYMTFIIYMALLFNFNSNILPDIYLFYKF